MNHIFKNNVKISLKGKNINLYLKRIIKQKINIVKLIPISYNQVNLIISYSDYLKLLKYKSIYEIEIVNYYGIKRIINKIKNNYIILSSLLFSIIFIIILSNIIFDIEIIHSNVSTINLVKKELDYYNIKKYTFRKKYDELEEIISRILESNKDKLEWLEITRSGTKYIVRVEERKIDTNTFDNKPRNIIASKNSIIKEIYAYNGEKIKDINDYVKQGDIIINGVLTKTNGEFIYKKSIGKVYGEVWYNIEIEYPFIYKEERLTGKVKEVYVLNFFNKRISLFDFNKYKTFKTTSNYIFNTNFNLLSFVKEKQYELDVIDVIYSKEELEKLATDLAKNKLLEQNSKIKEITNIKIVKEENMNSKMQYKFFISVLEDITEYQDIDINSTN